MTNPSGSSRPAITPASHSRVRYRREVDATHLGGRVSIRHLVNDAEHGPVPTDVVGRLLSYDPELVLLVDRKGRLRMLSTPSIVASKAIPEHPRLPAEPFVGTYEQPLQREAARALLICENRCLLVAHRPAADEIVWTAPGGGINEAEEPRVAAEREVREEIGVDVSLGPLVLERTATFPFRNAWLTQHELWFAGLVDPAEAADVAARAPLDDPGISEARWWTADDMERGTAVAPARLPQVVRAFIAHGAPSTPWRFDEPAPAEHH
ncbi:MAG: NUDIX hydrolase [Nitriliruptoraceae bacterium]